MSGRLRHLCHTTSLSAVAFRSAFPVGPFAFRKTRRRRSRLHVCIYIYYIYIIHYTVAPVPHVFSFPVLYPIQIYSRGVRYAGEFWLFLQKCHASPPAPPPLPLLPAENTSRLAGVFWIYARFMNSPRPATPRGLVQPRILAYVYIYMYTCSPIAAYTYIP